MAIRGHDWLAEVELALDTVQYADNDLLANPVEVVDAVESNGCSTVRSVCVIDTDDQGATFGLVFFGANPGNLGTLNAAFAISDAQAAMVQGFIVVNTYDDLGAQQVGMENNCELVVRPEDGGTSIWVAAISGGTGTYASGRLTLKIGLERR